MTVAQEKIDEFQRDGFVVTPGIFTDAELDEFTAAVDAEVAKRSAADERTVEDKSTYEQSFVQCMRLWETEPAVAPFTFHLGLAKAAAELLGEPQLLLWQDQALYKEPGGRITDAHQDLTFWPVGEAPLISAWIPLVDVTIDNGAMGYVPGSHHAGRLKVVDITHSSEPYDILRDPALGGREIVWVEAPRGSVVWHHGLTVHQASANNTSEARRVFTVVYLAAGHRRTKPWPTFPLDRAGVAVGELMEGPGLPVAWPREANDYPAPDARLGTPTGPQQKFE